MHLLLPTIGPKIDNVAQIQSSAPLIVLASLISTPHAALLFPTSTPILLFFPVPPSLHPHPTSLLLTQIVHVLAARFEACLIILLLIAIIDGTMPIKVESLLGYASHQKGYCCLDPQTGRVYISRHVKFGEHTFPFSQPPSQPLTATSPFSSSPIIYLYLHQAHLRLLHHYLLHLLQFSLRLHRTHHFPTLIPWFLKTLHHHQSSTLVVVPHPDLLPTLCKPALKTTSISPRHCPPNIHSQVHFFLHLHWLCFPTLIFKLQKIQTG